MTNEEFLKDVCPNHTEQSKWNRNELLHILELHEKQLRIGGVVSSISVYSNADDERLDYRKDYVFHHFVSKRKALIEDKESGQLMEVHYGNFKFA